jgi:hypothetical protein
LVEVIGHYVDGYKQKIGVSENTAFPVAFSEKLLRGNCAGVHYQTGWSFHPSIRKYWAHHPGKGADIIVGCLATERIAKLNGKDV